MKSTFIHIGSVFVLMTFVCCMNVDAQVYRTSSGWNALDQEFGGSLANGTGVVVSQVESPTGMGAYLANSSDNNFLNPDKNFVDLSQLSSGVSTHANNVGKNIFGNNSSIASGVIDIFQYETNDWINNVTGIGVGQGVDPQPQPYDVQNHSWVGNGLTSGLAANISARVDYMANQDDVSIIVGIGNSTVASVPQLLAHSYNIISVGVTDGTHTDGLTRFYGLDRIKPELVAPEGVTSFSTGRVSSASAVLRDASQGTNADHNEAIKAMLLAGATKTEFADWSNSPTMPIDTVVGAGELNIYNSYKIFLAGETDGESTPPSTPTGSTGWDFDTAPSSGTLNYTIELTEPADHVSIVLTWNIEVVDSNNSPSTFSPSTTLGDLDMFLLGGGIDTQVSNSTNHNIEHIYVRDVPAGTYTLVVLANRMTDFGLAWRSAHTIETPNENLTVVTGINSGGNVSSVDQSDNNYFVIQPSPKAASQQFASVVEFETTSPVNMANSIQFDIESHVNTVNVEQEIEIFNFTTQQFVPFSNTTASQSDSTVLAYVTGELYDFVNSSTGQIRARVTWRPVGPVLQFPWSIRIDKASWNVSQ